MLYAATLGDSRDRRAQRFLKRYKNNVEDSMSDLEFVQNFRLDKSSFRLLIGDLKNLTNLKGTREHPLEVKVLCTLSFLATGSYQRIVGVSQHLVQRTVSRFVREVVKALSCKPMLEKWVVFPTTTNKRNQIKPSFLQRYNMLGTIGCIDCTHIAIVRPNRNEHMFYNRKGYHSLNERTVRRKLKNLDFKACRPARKPKLTAAMKEKRLKWAKQWRDKDINFWKLVCFSDENTFEILQNKAQFVRRRHGEKFHPDCIVPTVKHPTKVRIWSVISGKGTGRLYVVNGIMKQDQ